MIYQRGDSLLITNSKATARVGSAIWKGMTFLSRGRSNALGQLIVHSSFYAKIRSILACTYQVPEARLTSIYSVVYASYYTIWGSVTLATQQQCHGVNVYSVAAIFWVMVPAWRCNSFHIIFILCHWTMFHWSLNAHFKVSSDAMCKWYNVYMQILLNHTIYFESSE